MYSYKTNSTYRLFLLVGLGRIRTMVFKNARLGPEAFPAVEGFPGAVGMPEWDVLSREPAPLATFLPAVYSAVEIEPGRHNHYLLEDLAWRYRRVRGDADLGAAVTQLKSVLGALQGWRAESAYEPRLRHDRSGAKPFLDYVHGSLTKFVSVRPDATSEKVLERWSDVEAAYFSSATVDAISSGLVHGDFNGQNLFIHPKGPAGLRVVDWEWMGLGPPHIDIASALKYASPDFQRAAVRRYFEDDETLDEHGHWQVFLWARLQRSLLDAALHARQNAAGIGHTPDDVAHHLTIMETVTAAIREKAP